MKARYILLLLIAVLLVQGVAALDAGEISIGHDKDWITAGTTDKATLTVTVNNASVQVTGVTFTVEGSYTGYASFGTTQKISDTEYRTTFWSTKSGTPAITATVAYTVAGVPRTPVSKTVTQNVDHASPYRYTEVTFEREVTVFTTTPITVKVADRYGNLIDSRYEDATAGIPEQVTFSCEPPTAGFWDGVDYSHRVYTVPVNAAGEATVTFRTSTIAGPNSIDIKPPSPLPSRLITIEGIADGEPVSIVVSVSPNVGTPPYVPVDGASFFTLTYTLLDMYGNPSINRQVDIETTFAGEEQSLFTNDYGQIVIQYGPRDTIGVFTITASAADNPAVTVSTTVEFVSTAPVDMVFTASPQVMPSNDVDAGLTSTLRAKVIDEKGNPVDGETVTFQIFNIASNPASTADPYLVSPTAVTDADGYAMVQFVPGAFETNRYDINYDETAQSSCDVRAMWGPVSRALTLEWMNFPYLSVECEVTPETVAVNDTVDVTIRLIGNGYALQPDPIDVMLVVDRSGSMLRDYPDRMVSTMDAAKIFNGEMAEGRDQVGLVSFGRKGTADIYSYSYRYWAGIDSTSSDDSTYISAHYPSNGKYYDDYATLDLGLSFDHATVETSVDTLVPMDGTPMRGGIYKAIKEIRDNGRAEAVRALIVLSDGDYNWYGDPLARGTGYTYYSPTSFSDLTSSYYYFSDITGAEQDMRVFATNNNIKIYTIAFADSISSGGRTTLQLLAEGTGGEYYYAPTGDDLAAVYTDIAGKLKTEAGVDTSMDVVFSNIELNNITVPNPPGDPILEYVYAPGESTNIESWNLTHTIIPLHTIDQSDDWAANRSLNYDVSEIGTIHLNQTWETTFRLLVLKPGNINIFGPGSQIVFDYGNSTLTLPDTFVTAVPNLTAVGIVSPSIRVYDVSHLEQPNYVDYVDVLWSLNYTGSTAVLQELRWVRYEDAVERKFATIKLPYNAGVPPFNGVDFDQTTKLNVINLAAGNYTIYVTAIDEQGYSSEASDNIMIPVKAAGLPFIKIE